MSGGGDQPDILSVGILVKERWKVVSMPSCNSVSFLKHVFRKKWFVLWNYLKILVRYMLFHTYINLWMSFKITYSFYPTLKRSYEDLKWVIFFPDKDLRELLNPNVVPDPSTTGRVLFVYWTQSANDYVSPFWRSDRCPPLKLVSLWDMLLLIGRSFRTLLLFLLFVGFYGIDLFSADLYSFDCVPALALP